MVPNSPALLDSAAAAQALGVHQKTLARWVRDGKVRAMRTPGGRFRFRQSDLDSFVAESMAVQPDEESA